MEVLNFELLDSLAEDSIHLAHMNQFVVDVIDSGLTAGLHRVVRRRR